MKKIAPLTALLLAAPLWLLPAATAAADCASEARNYASAQGAEVLNVADLGNGKCEVTLRIPGKDGKPPRVVSKKING